MEENKNFIEKDNQIYNQLKDIKNPKIFYISNPHAKKSGFKTYVCYDFFSEKLNNNKEENTRRYSDFFELREKLLLNWPGIYIPPIPGKKMVGNIEDKTIELRFRLLNSFCYKISQFKFLLNSEEIKIFIENKNPIKVLEKIKRDSFDLILKRYKTINKNYYEEYDLVLGKGKLLEYKTLFQKCNKNLEKILKSINIYITQKENEINMYINFIKSMKEYEIASENKETFFANEINNELKTLINKFNNLKDELKNPFILISNYIEDQLLDFEAIFESFNKLDDLNDELSKLNKKKNEILDKIRDVKNNVKGFVSLITGKEQSIENLNKNKEEIEKEINTLNQIIKLATFYNESFLEEYKKQMVKEYNRNINLYCLGFKINNEILIDRFDNLKKIVKSHIKKEDK